MTNPTSLTVTPPGPEDFTAWRELYRGYADFYRIDMPDERAELVWSWIHDPGHEVECLLVRTPGGAPVGLAHYRPYARPSSGSVGGYLDDLFVSPDARGSGAADLLLARLRETAAERGWTIVRWITADDNHRARGKYDQVATRTMWVTYDMPPAAQTD